MSEAFAPLPPKKDDTRFPQAPTVVGNSQALATPVRITEYEQPEESPRDPREVAAEKEARRTVLEATGKIKRRKKIPNSIPQASGGVPPAGR